MDFIGDFHIHGPYAQACSRNTTLEKLEAGAKIKGLDILGTGDCLHPKWFDQITKTLTEDEKGIVWSKTKFPFLWQTEISLMYTHNGKGRRIHHVLLFPNKEIVIQVRDMLLKRGRLDYDGRPIFGINSIEFVDMMRSVSPDIEIIPAHAWTSWMAIFGSKSGFNSVEECFEDRAKYIHAIETGISSDPPMNRRVSSLDKYNLVSFSDPHSSHPWRLGREATMFDAEISYKAILNAIRTGKGLKGTIEANPEYGKYHIDGHRACNVALDPAETKKLKGICPVCKNPLTIGVAYRIEELADRKEPKNVPQYEEVIPLTELIAAVYQIKQLDGKKVWEVYNNLIKNHKNEYNILLNAPFEDLKKTVDEKLVDVILLNREHKLNIKPGYDGVYGEIVLTKEQSAKVTKQKYLGEF
ncbi:DNA helicase UvrD [Candidatus Woesearchaeota archaeon]|nr:DNA helicase UvrD [Candidatus Woesearchaeota archaeon]